MRLGIRRRNALWAVLCLGFAFDARSADSMPPVMKDEMELPPPVREFRSPNGAFRLTLTNSDGWKSRYVLAQLDTVVGKIHRQQWQAMLPHERGPRHVFLTNTGALVLMDEWINSPSQHALMLLSPKGQSLLLVSLDELINMLGVERQAITRHARLGVWLTSIPVVDADAAWMAIEVAGRILDIQLATGQWKVRR